MQKEHINNNYNTPELDHIITSETLQTNTKKQLTMSTPEHPTTSGPNRRRAQRFKRGGHQSQLGSQARVNITQLLHRKGQTHAPPDTDERSLAIGRVYDAPLHAKMLSPHAYPAIGQRGEIDNDCLYIHHPSRRLDLQSGRAHWLSDRSRLPARRISSTTRTFTESTRRTRRLPVSSRCTSTSHKQHRTTSPTSLPPNWRICTNKGYKLHRTN